METIFIILYVATHVFVVLTVCYYIFNNKICCCYRYDLTEDVILPERVAYTVSTPRTVCSEENSVYSSV